MRASTSALRAGSIVPSASADRSASSVAVGFVWSAREAIVALLSSWWNNIQLNDAE